MATLRRYSSFQTRRRNRILNAKKALLGITCLFVGAAVFTSVNALKPDGKPSILAATAVPIADRLARALQANPQSTASAARPIIIAPAYPVAAAPTRQDINKMARELAATAADRRAAEQRLMQQGRNMDPTPVASISRQTHGFRELETSPSAPGFRQISR